MTDIDSKPRFVLSLDAQMIGKRLRAMKIGDKVTYEELDKLIGRDSRKHGLQGALRDAMRGGCVFGCITGVGLRRLNDAEIIDKSTEGIERVNRAARRNIRTLTLVAYDSLTDQQKLKHNTTMTVFALTQANTSRASIVRIEQKVKDTNASLPAALAAAAALGKVIA